MEQDDLIVPEPYTRAWVSDLLGITSDGLALICKCGLERMTDDSSSTVDYFLCRLDVATKQPELLTLLESVWF